MRAQVPRLETSTLPATCELPSAVCMYSASEQPSETPPVPVPELSGSTWMGRDPLGSVGLPLLFCAVSVLPVFKVTLAPGKVAVESIAAAAIVLSPAAGEPRKYGAGPALPAAATTIRPASAAASDASASAVSSGPKSAPRDMLITSIPCSTAQSIASTTTLVDPAQPKTRTAYTSASGATPGPMRKRTFGVLALYGPRKVLPLSFSPKPAAVPATWLPWPLQSSGFGSGCGTGWNAGLVGSAV